MATILQLPQKGISTQLDDSMMEDEKRLAEQTTAICKSYQSNLAGRAA